MQVEFLGFFFDNRFTTLLNILLQTLVEMLKNIVILNSIPITLKEELKVQEGHSISLVNNKRTTSWLENTIRQTIVNPTQHRKLKTGTALALSNTGGCRKCVGNVSRSCYTSGRQIQ